MTYPGENFKRFGNTVAGDPPDDDESKWAAAPEICAELRCDLYPSCLFSPEDCAEKEEDRKQRERDRELRSAAPDILRDEKRDREMIEGGKR